MGIFSKESRNLCYFCNNDYFELFRTLDNHYVCKDCLTNDSLDGSDIMCMTLDEVVKSKEGFVIDNAGIASYDTYCSVCSKSIGSGSSDYVSLNSMDYCRVCGSDKIKSIDKSILLTAGSVLPGRVIDEYVDLVSVEALISLGYNMSYESQSIFGNQLGDKDLKFVEAKNVAVSKLKIAAFNLGGDAIIGVNVTSSVFYDKRSVIVTGTVVKTKEISS